MGISWIKCIKKCERTVCIIYFYIFLLYLWVIDVSTLSSANLEWCTTAALVENQFVEDIDRGVTKGKTGQTKVLPKFLKIPNWQLIRYLIHTIMRIFTRFCFVVTPPEGLSMYSSHQVCKSIVVCCTKAFSLCLSNRLAWSFHLSIFSCVSIKVSNMCRVCNLI